MKNIRRTKFYKNLDSYNAIGIAEGFVESNNENEVIAAWQYIWDKSLWKGLQGFFGRTVHNLLDQGLILK